MSAFEIFEGSKPRGTPGFATRHLRGTVSDLQSGVWAAFYRQNYSPRHATATRKKTFRSPPSPNNLRYDYTADGVRRSIDDSLQRLGVDALDVVFIRDLSPDNPWLPERWEQQFDIARKCAFPALSKMRDEGAIKGWGSPMQTCVSWRQYSLVAHENALHQVLPRARECASLRTRILPEFWSDLRSEALIENDAAVPPET